MGWDRLYVFYSIFSLYLCASWKNAFSFFLSSERSKPKGYITLWHSHVIWRRYCNFYWFKYYAKKTQYYTSWGQWRTVWWVPRPGTRSRRGAENAPAPGLPDRKSRLWLTSPMLDLHTKQCRKKKPTHNQHCIHLTCIVLSTSTVMRLSSAMFAHFSSR